MSVLCFAARNVDMHTCSLLLLQEGTRSESVIGYVIAGEGLVLLSFTYFIISSSTRNTHAGNNVELPGLSGLDMSHSSKFRNLMLPNEWLILWQCSLHTVA